MTLYSSSICDKIRGFMGKLSILTLTLLLTLSGLFADLASAQQGELTIAYVNVRKILSEAPQRLDITKRLETDFREENTQIKTLEAEIIELSNQMKEGNDLSGEEVLLYKQRESIRLKEKLKDEYNLRRNEEIAKLQQLIVKVIADISRERHIDLVLNSTGVVYVSTRVDITALVLSRLQGVTLE